jgi:hypothetical protein
VSCFDVNSNRQTVPIDHRFGIDPTHEDSVNMMVVDRTKTSERVESLSDLNETFAQTRPLVPPASGHWTFCRFKAGDREGFPTDTTEATRVRLVVNH